MYKSLFASGHNCNFTPPFTSPTIDIRVSSDDVVLTITENQTAVRQYRQKATERQNFIAPQAAPPVTIVLYTLYQPRVLLHTLYI